MCEVYNADGTPNISNARATIQDDDPTNWWFGFEQEYVLEYHNKPYGFPKEWFPEPQGKYYCGVWYETMSDLPRQLVEEHLDICLDAGIDITCINAEVLKGQWEYCILSKWAKKAGDDVWLARYIMMRLGEKYWITLELAPKPILGDWNGTGMHCNFSNKYMREEWGEMYFTEICEEIGKYIPEHIAVYGSWNEKRLTGAHETQRIDQFSYGVSDRGASIRIPLATVHNNRRWRLEDRRVAANADPYKVVSRLLTTLSSLS